MSGTVARCCERQSRMAAERSSHSRRCRSLSGSVGPMADDVSTVAAEDAGLMAAARPIRRS